MIQNRSGGNFERVKTGSEWALEALLDGIRAPDQAQRGPKNDPRRSPTGPQKKGKDDPEAEGLKKEGAKSSKMGTITKRTLNVYGKYILKESVCRYTKKSPYNH